LADFPVEIDLNQKEIIDSGGFFQTYIGLKKPSKVLMERIENNRIIYEEVFKATRVNTLIDSSKNMTRALFLKKYLKGYDFKFLFLVRDGRGVVNSYLKPSYSIIEKDKESGAFKTVKYPRNPSDPQRIIKSWRNGNLKTLLFLTLFQRGGYRIVRHEDFCNKPEETFRKIGEYVGFDFQEIMLKMGQVPNHIFGGNSSRINAKEIRKTEDSWKSKLKPEIIAAFNKKAGFLNNYLGY